MILLTFIQKSLKLKNQIYKNETQGTQLLLVLIVVKSGMRSLRFYSTGE